MSHPTDSLLNEYLDETLDLSTRGEVETHIGNCDACREKLGLLEGVALVLSALPDEPLPHDLTHLVRDKLAHRSLGLAWKLALAVQAGFVTGLLLLLAPLVTGQLVETVTGLAGRALGAVPSLPGFEYIPPAIHPLRFPQFPVFRMPVSLPSSNTSAWLVLGIAACLLFIVGNFSLLFRNSPGDKK
jgi:hypothetical protein